MSEIKEYLSREIESKEIAGASIIVRKNGNIVIDECLGYSDISTNTVLNKNSIFRYASMSKLITAVAIMQEVEEGNLSLDDSLLKYFPEFTKDKKIITVRHLLNHCPGMGQGSDSETFYKENFNKVDSLKQHTEKWKNMPLDYQPGTNPTYSGIVAFDLLGRIVEIVEDEDFYSVIKRRILEPLGMIDTCFKLNGEQKKRLVKLYAMNNGELIESDDFITDWEVLETSPSASLMGTLIDYDKFTNMIYNDGELYGIRILSEESIRLMATPRQITDEESLPGCPWGLGFMVFEYPEKMNFSLGNGSFGWSGAFGTHMYIDTSNELCLTLMVNRADIGGFDSYISHDIEHLVMKEFSES